MLSAICNDSTLAGQTGQKGQPLMSEVPAPTTEEGKLIKEASRGGTVWGVAIMLMGIIAVGAPLVAGLATTVIVASLVLASGIAQTVFAFRAVSFGRGVARFLFGGLTAICGLAMLAWPGAALASLTMFLAAYFVMDGLFILVASFQWRPERGWGWMALNGAVTLILGWFIARDWPLSGIWAIGVLLGVRLIMSGWTIIVLGAIGGAVGSEVEGSAESA
jgi:uncharacterized membrane protein HdeD (DUF308 family)